MNRRGLSAFVDALVRDRRPRPFRPDPDDVEAMRAAIELRAARADASSPDPEFVRELHDQLRRDLQERPAPAPAPHPVRVPRRWVLEGAAVAAAAGLGVAVDRTVFAPGHHQGPPLSERSLVPDNGTWQTVARRAAVQEGEVTRFDEAGAVGFVAEQQGALVAVSGVCTHLGCLLQLNPAERRLDCPCHRTSFGLSGDVLFSQLTNRPGPLPRLEVRDRAGQIEVYLPRPV